MEIKLAEFSNRTAFLRVLLYIIFLSTYIFFLIASAHEYPEALKLLENLSNLVPLSASLGQYLPSTSVQEEKLPPPRLPSLRQLHCLRRSRAYARSYGKTIGVPGSLST